MNIRNRKQREEKIKRKTHPSRPKSGRSGWGTQEINRNYSIGGHRRFAALGPYEQTKNQKIGGKNCDPTGRPDGNGHRRHRKRSEQRSDVRWRCGRSNSPQGGEKLDPEWKCDAIGTIPVGYAAITSGGKLKAKHVIHAASMELGGITTPDALWHSVAHALRLCW